MQNHGATMFAISILPHLPLKCSPKPAPAALALLVPVQAPSAQACCRPAFDSKISGQGATIFAIFIRWPFELTPSSLSTSSSAARLSARTKVSGAERLPEHNKKRVGRGGVHNEHGRARLPSGA
jgi:hypothetical protein